MRYSQNDEQDHILAHFAGKQDGNFLDIGAYDGKTLSNTYALVEQGWSGVCVEPSPVTFTALLKLHGDNPKIKLLHGAITLASGFMPFYDSNGDAVSSTLPAHVQKWSAGTGIKFTAFDILPVPMPLFFQQYGYAYDFINLDVEGYSFDLFQNLPFAQLSQTSCICVEHDGHAAEIAVIGGNYNFKTAAINGENIILTR